MNTARSSGDVNYEPSITQEFSETPANAYATMPLSGTTQQRRIDKTDNFSQAGAFYAALDSAAKQRLVNSFAGDLGQAKSVAVKAKLLGFLLQANEAYGTAVAQKVGPAG